MRAVTLLFASAVLLAGCPTRNQLQEITDGSANDGDGSPPNIVSITSPTATITYTNGSVSIVVTTRDPTTSSISIVASGATTTTVGTVTAPQTFSWNTTTVPEGTYSVTAQLTSNGKTETSNAVMIVVDRTAPQVVVSSLVPAPGASNVVLAASLVVGFSEPVLASTVTSTFVTLQAGTTVLPTTVALSSDGKTATITITNHAGITLPLTFTATLSTTVTDLAGNQLTALTAPGWTWAVPDWIKLSPINSGGPPLFAVSSDFDAVLGYAVCGAGNGGGSSCSDVLHVAVSDQGAWNDLGAVDPTAVPTSSALAVDAQNHPIAAWGFETTASVGEVLFSTWTGSAWNPSTYPPIVLPASEGVSVDRVVLRLDASGNPVVAYRGNVFLPTAGTDIYVAKWTGTAWDTTLGAVGAPASTSFDLILTEQGSPIVSVISGSINGAFLWNGTSWTLTSGVAATNAFAALDAAGNPVMLNSSGTSWVPEHLTNGTWLPSVSSPVPSSSTSNDPNITNTPGGLPAVAWYDPSVTPHGIRVARWTGSAWDNRASPAYVMFGPEDEPPSIVIDARGSLWIAWAETLQAVVWMSNY